MHRYQEFDALIAAVLALAVTLITCWLLGTIVPPAPSAEVTPRSAPLEGSDWVY